MGGNPRWPIVVGVGRGEGGFALWPWEAPGRNREREVRAGLWEIGRTAVTTQFLSSGSNLVGYESVRGLSVFALESYAQLICR